ncbi:retrovirus-related pol polyprotein from transposon TNT 1-94 [Tanacetum coccineum]
MDVKSAFLNGMLEEDVYVEQLPWYMKIRNEKKVLKLKNALHGLKQALRAWNTRINTYFKDNGFKQCPYEQALYVKKTEEVRQGESDIFCLIGGICKAKSKEEYYESVHGGSGVFTLEDIEENSTIFSRN